MASPGTGTSTSKSKRCRRGILEERPIDEAKRVFFETLEEIGFFAAPEEELAVQDSLWRITSRAVYAERDVPHFRSSVMDGIAVRAADTAGASEEEPKALKEGLDFAYVDTGEPIPQEFDAVIMIEQIKELGDGRVEVYAPAYPGQYVRQIGEDFKKGALVIPANYKIRPETIATLISTGNLKVHVKRKLRAIFIPTGSELVPPNHPYPLKAGLVPESNSQVFKGYLELWGAEAKIHPIVSGSTSQELKDVVEKTLKDFDLIAIGAGTSKGAEDFTYKVVQELGKVLVHGVASRPGHPVLLGMIEKRAVMGIPGPPFANWVSTIQFIRPLIAKYLGLSMKEPLKVKGKLASSIRSIPGYREFVRVRLEQTEEGVLVQPLPGGSSRLSSLVNASGIIEIPEEVEALDAGEEVKVQLLKSFLEV